MLCPLMVCVTSCNAPGCGMRVLIVVEEIKNAAPADGHILEIS
jgi:hypothetical protein